jgi:lysophospholipase L1-like esterase
MIVAPFNASYIRLAGYKTDDTMRIAECIPANNKDSKLLSGKKWVAVGDSITEYNQRATKNYLNYISEETGIEVINRGRSGSGFKRTDNEGFAFYQTISSIPESDVITIMASGNDMNAGVELGNVTDISTSTLCGCINTTLTNLFNKYPLARVGVITPIPWGSYNPANDNAMKRYANAIVEICKNRGIPCLDLYHSSGLRPWETSYLNLCYTRDEGNNVHPDENGHAVIYPQIREFIKKLV